MNRETLIKHLENPALVSALKEKQIIDSYEKGLRKSIELLRGVCMDEETIADVELKHKEYQKISKGYDQMIETVWGLQWQAQAIVERYINCDYAELQELPSDIKL